MRYVFLQEDAMLTISFPKLEWGDSSDQIRIESFCNSLQAKVEHRIRMITDPEAVMNVVLDSENVAKIAANDWSSFNDEESVLFFHMDCCVDSGVDPAELKRLFQASVEKVCSDDLSWKSEVWKKAVLLQDDRNQSAQANLFFRSQMCINLSYLSKSENMPGKDQVNTHLQDSINNQLLEYISYWRKLINKTSDVDEFVMLFADPDTKRAIGDGGWANRITIELKESHSSKKKLCVKLQLKFYNPVDDKGNDKSETEAASVSYHISWLLEYMFREYHGQYGFKFRLLLLDELPDHHPGQFSSGLVAVKGMDGQNPGASAIFHCSYETQKPAPQADKEAEKQLRKLLEKSKMLKYAVYGFKVHWRPAIVRFYDNCEAEPQDYVEMWFGESCLVPATPELMTKTKQAFDVNIKNRYKALIFFALESKPGSIVLSAHIPMWVLRIVEAICKEMDWSSLNLPLPSINWQKLEKYCHVSMAQTQHLLDAGGFKEQYMWKNVNALFCKKCLYTVSLDNPPLSCFYGTSEGLSNLLSCYKTYSCDCLERKKQYLACSICKTGQEYHDRSAVELHLLQCRQMDSEAFEKSALSEETDSAVAVLCLLYRKMVYKLGTLTTVPTVKVIGFSILIHSQVPPPLQASKPQLYNSPILN
jgi:hypothetical protein